MYSINDVKVVDSVDHLLTVCSLYTEISENIDTFTFSVEHQDWAVAKRTYDNMFAIDKKIMALTNESILSDFNISASQLSTESSMAYAFMSSIDKIPSLIIKIAGFVIGLIIAAVVFFKKRLKNTRTNLSGTNSLHVKDYLGLGSPEAYIKHYEHLHSVIIKLVSILEGHMHRDIDGMSQSMSAAASRLEDYITWTKNPLKQLKVNSSTGFKGDNVKRLIKEYRKELSHSLASLSGLYLVDVHENRGVYIVNPTAHSVDSVTAHYIDNSESLNKKIKELRNADIDTILRHYLITTTLRSSDVKSLELDHTQTNRLYSLIDQCNHNVANLIERFESGISNIKDIMQHVTKQSDQLAELKVAGKNRDHLREILDEVTLSSKAITTLIRDMQSLAIHLVIKY